MNDVVTVKCIASKFTDLSKLEDAKNYYHSLDHEFWLNVGENYFLLGLTTMSGVPYFYVFSKNMPLEVEVQPTVLFDLDWTKIPNNWHMRVREKTRAIEMAPYGTCRPNSTFITTVTF